MSKKTIDGTISIFLLLIYILFGFGVLLPMLISAPNTMFVIMGIVLIPVTIGLIIYEFNNIYKNYIKDKV